MRAFAVVRYVQPHLHDRFPGMRIKTARLGRSTETGCMQLIPGSFTVQIVLGVKMQAPALNFGKKQTHEIFVKL
jgi:hypothetical protein